MKLVFMKCYKVPVIIQNTGWRFSFKFDCTLYTASEGNH